MIINKSIGFAFIHIPKTAGTSVTHFLAPMNGPFDLEIGGTDFGEMVQEAFKRRHGLRKHSTFAEARKFIFQPSSPREMFVFTFVRNPYSRLASIFYFLRRWENYDAALLHKIRSFSDFTSFAESGIYTRYKGPDNIFLPQSEWLKFNSTIATEITIYKIEDLQKAICSIRSLLARRAKATDDFLTDFPHSNRSQLSDASQLSYSSRALALVNDFYAEDFQAFGYEQLEEPYSGQDRAMLLS